MGLLDSVLDNDDAKAQFGDFVERLTDGSPTDDKVSEGEAYDRYGQVRDQIDRDEYVESARATFDRLDPDERAAVGQQLRSAADGHGIRRMDDGNDDPSSLSGLVGGLLDGGVDLDSILRGLPGGLSKGMLGGIAAMAAKKFL